MGWIWTVMVSFSNEELWEEGEGEAKDNCEALDNINVWLAADEVRKYGPLTELTACANGNEVGMSANLYGGGFKHFDIEGFLKNVKNQNWHDPGNLQVFIKGEEDEKFTVLEYDDL
jgi:hypothetical protein